MLKQLFPGLIRPTIIEAPTRSNDLPVEMPTKTFKPVAEAPAATDRISILDREDLFALPTPRQEEAPGFNVLDLLG